jgi:hypothetical protein
MYAVLFQLIKITFAIDTASFTLSIKECIGFDVSLVKTPYSALKLNLHF